MPSGHHTNFSILISSLNHYSPSLLIYHTKLTSTYKAFINIPIFISFPSSLSTNIIPFNNCVSLSSRTLPVSIKMPPFKPFIISTWSVLDYIKQENNTSHPITDYPDFVHWIIKKEVPKGEQIPPLISEWISLCTTTEHFATLDSLRLEQELMEKTNYRAFRTASATYPTPTDNDSRVSDLIRFMISKPKLKFTWTCLLNHFFSNREGLERREVYKGVFFTRPSTHFQQLMFLSVVLQLKNTVGKSRGRNNGFTLTPNNGQRIGWALQTVMRGWDSFAKFLNFKNIEQMILPYISICNESIHIFVLHSRDLGYLPIRSQSSLEFPLKPTTVASETFNYAAEQDEEVDAQLRILASLFLENCIGSVSNADLYTLSATGSWPLINRFQVEGNDLPTRFHQLPWHWKDLRRSRR